MRIYKDYSYALKQWVYVVEHEDKFLISVILPQDVPIRIYPEDKIAGIAQQDPERRSSKPKVVGSNPTTRTNSEI